METVQLVYTQVERYLKTMQNSMEYLGFLQGNCGVDRGYAT